MKYVKTPFLIFLIFSLFILVSCDQKKRIETIETTENDSLNYYVQQLKDRTFSDSISLRYANSALRFINKTATTEKIIKEILGYKVYLFGNLRQRIALYIRLKNY